MFFLLLGDFIWNHTLVKKKNEKQRRQKKTKRTRGGGGAERGRERVRGASSSSSDPKPPFHTVKNPREIQVMCKGGGQDYLETGIPTF